MQPSSAAAERVVLILSSTFSTAQESSLEDYIRQSVDCLCRDGTDMRIVRVHWKPAKLPSARVLSLPKHLPILLQCFSTQRYPPSS